MTAAAPVLDPVTSYAEDVAGGRVAAGRLVRLQTERHLRDLQDGHERGLRFDDAAAKWAIDFFPTLLRHSKGEWAGRALTLRPWQCFIIGSIFGWKREYGQCSACDSWSVVDVETGLIRCDNPECEPNLVPPAAVEWLRRFRLAYVEIPRKNGKSTLGAGVGLMLAFFDDEPGAEVYAAATKRDQAKIVWGEAARMVKSSPNIRRRIRVLVANLNDPHSNSKFEPLGADANNMDGLNVHGRIIDELHKHKSRALWDVLETATGARRQPLGFVITTAGSDRETVCYEQHEYSIKVLEQVLDDDSHFAYIATIDEGDDPFDPTTWAKANPNLGVSVKLDYLQGKAKKAREVAGEQNAFLRDHMDVWTQSVSRWLTIDLWNAGAAGPGELKGRKCFAGIHTTTDFASISLWFPDDHGGDVLTYFFIPDDRLQQLEDDDGVPYWAWAREGHIEITEGNVTDYDLLQKRLDALAERYDIGEVAIHRYNSTQLQSQLVGAGYTIVPFSSGFAHFAGPTEETERLLVAQKVRHGGNPVLRWMASNISVRQNAERQKRPDQETSGGRIGGMIGMIMAIGRAAATVDEGEEYHGIYIPEDEEDDE